MKKKLRADKGWYFFIDIRPSIYVAGCKFKHHHNVMSFGGGSSSFLLCLSARFLLLAAHCLNFCILYLANIYPVLG